MRMLAGRNNVTRDNVSFNYQLNDKRVKLAVFVGEARSDENINIMTPSRASSRSGQPARLFI